MKSKFFIIGFIVFIILMLSVNVNAKEKLMVFCGAAFKQPVEEIIKTFSAKTKIEVDVIYGGVGSILSQIMLSKRGDLFIAPSSYVMNQAKSKGLLVPDSIESFGYVVPTINVQKDNPRGILSLKDLARPAVRVAIANPEIVFVGMLAVELVDKALVPEERIGFKKNVVTTPEDFNKLATLLIFKKVDAIIGFHYLGYLYPDKIDTIKLQPYQVQRIGAGQVGILSFSKIPALAEKFKSYIVSGESKQVFAKYHYFATTQDAFAWIGAQKPVGGEYPVSGNWLQKE